MPPQPQQQMPPMDMGQPEADPQMNAGADANASMPDEMPQDNGQSEFDTNFDAGVSADEDTDPKKYIQQLTGKLSQSLSSYNNENGDDPELSKYVGKMIVKQAAKGLDDNGKKELVKAINSVKSDNGDEEIEDEPIDGDMPIDDSGNADDLNEESYTIGHIDEILNTMIAAEKEAEPKMPKKKKCNSPFCGKQYK